VVAAQASNDAELLLPHLPVIHRASGNSLTYDTGNNYPGLH